MNKDSILLGLILCRLILRYEHNYSDAKIARLLGAARGTIAVTLCGYSCHYADLHQFTGTECPGIAGAPIFANYLPGDEPIFFGLNREDGTLAIVACFNNDLENFWDWIGTPAYPLRPATEAFRVGANLVIYSLTH